MTKNDGVSVAKVALTGSVVYREVARRSERAAERLRAAKGELIAALRAHNHARSEHLHRAAARLARRHPAAVYAARRTTLVELRSQLVRTAKRALKAKSTAPIAQRLFAAPSKDTVSP